MCGPFLICASDVIENAADPRSMEAFEECDPESRQAGSVARAESELQRELRDMARQSEREVFAACCARLPRLEQVVLQLSLEGVNQREIAARLGITQPAISQRVRRAVGRMRDMLATNAHRFDAAELGGAGLEPEQIEVLAVYGRCSSAYGVAREMGIPPSTARYRLNSALAALRASGSEHASYLDAIRAHARNRHGSVRTTRPAPERVEEAARTVAKAPDYDGPWELRPCTAEVVSELQCQAARGVPMDVIATAHELDCAYVGYLVSGEWQT